MEDHSRLISAQHVHQERLVQNGIVDIHTGEHASRYVGYVRRLGGRIFPCSDPQELQKVHESGIVWQSMAIPSDADGAQCLGSNIHQDNCGTVESREMLGRSHPCIYRRLDFESMAGREAPTSDSTSGEVVHQGRPDGKHSQVGSGPVTSHNLCGDGFQAQGGILLCPSGKTTGDRDFDCQDYMSLGGHSQNVDIPSGHAGECHAPDSVGTVTQTPDTVVPPDQVAPEQRPMGQLDSVGGRVDRRPIMVDEEGEHETGSFVGAFFSGDHAVHGRQQAGVRSDLGPAGSEGCVEREATQHALEQSRNAGSTERSDKVLEGNPEQKTIDLYGQYNHYGDDKQTGGHQIVAVNVLRKDIVVDVGQVELYGESQTHSWEAECDGGLPEQAERSHSDGMVHAPSSIETSVGEMGNTQHRSICHTQEPQVTDICIAVAGPTSVGGGRNDFELEGSVRICVPAMGDSGPSPDENTGGRSGSHSDSPGLERSCVVPITTGDENGGANYVAQNEKPLDAGAFRQNAQQPRDAQSSCMEIIRRTVQGKGFSREVAHKMACNVRESSNKIYCGKWKQFAEWSHDRGNECPENSSIQEVAEFLNHLFEHRKLSVRTIQGYRTAIARVIDLVMGSDLAHDKLLSNLMTNFAIERPVAYTTYPKWDLSVVLDALRRKPYWPPEGADELHLAKKTAFLLLLASGARRGEIHALDISQTLEMDNGKSMLLRANPAFMAKNFDPKTGRRAFEGFKITRLDTYTDDEDGRKLCPLRSYRYYKHCTEARRGEVNHLFLSCKRSKTTKPASKNTLSSWIKQVVADAYKAADEHSYPVLFRSAHEVRALGASLALYQNVSMENILSQCRWAQQSTFTSFYLRNIMGADGNYQITPLQVAGSILGIPPQEH